MTAVSETPADLDEILPDNGRVHVEDIACTVRRLKSREFLKLVKVLTTGLGANIDQFDLTGAEEEVQGKLIAMIMLAIPEAADEFGDFVFSVVEAEDPKRNNDLQKALKNPEIDVFIDVLTVVAAQEANDFRSLVGKLKAALKIVQAAYRPTGK